MNALQRLLREIGAGQLDRTAKRLGVAPADIDTPEKLRNLCARRLRVRLLWFVPLFLLILFAAILRLLGLY